MIWIDNLRFHHLNSFDSDPHISNLFSQTHFVSFTQIWFYYTFIWRTIVSLFDELWNHYALFYLIRYLKVIFRQLKTYLSKIQISFLRKLGTPADINFILQNFCVHEMNENNKFHMWCLGDKFLYFLYYIGRTFYWFFRFSASSSHY